jgi:hypothetical protein
MMMDTWISRWEARFGVAPRLSEFFADSEARAFLRDFESGADVQGDVEVLAFLLIFMVWPDREWQKQPSRPVVQETVRDLEQARRSLGRVSETGWLGTPQRVKEVQEVLRQWAGVLRARATFMPSITVGTITTGGHPPVRGRQRGKRQVVFFLTYYFKMLGYRRPPWGLMTRFLILCRLVPRRTTAKDVATWWSTVLERHHRQKHDEPLAPVQESFLAWYQQCKASVWSSDGPAAERPN